ncbi:hypothetical protein ENKNEFLB_01938 [Nocardioides aquaticus]|uniref:DUF1905 domain-containing protein n=1 Tax=Nocardioides aquaticus TaxID=160826 RepID=A0ABX8EI48_9ACTN|nr:hypothetical protein ENKNEFLB_01938 [Nocardioides aquaticus]
MTDEPKVRKAGDIVCAGKGRVHVLARVTIGEGTRAFDLTVTPGVEWFLSQSTGGATASFSCKHGHAVVDLLELAKDMRSTSRRVRRTVNSA